MSDVTGSQPASPLADAAAGDFLRWRAGDEGGLDALVRSLTPLLWHLARGFRLDEAAAEDAVQSTWLALVRSTDRIESPQAVLRWLTVTVQREAGRAARRRNRSTPTEPDDFSDDPDAGPGPEEAVLAAGSARLLWRHVTQLSERCQQLLRVIAFADRPDYESLSRSLDMPVGSIGPTRQRCLAKLRDLLARDPEWVTA